MSLMRFYYNPVTGLDSLFDDAFGIHFQPSVSVVAKRSDLFRPRMDLHESEKDNTVTATFELPGMKSDDITIDVHRDRLTVAGEVKESRSEEEGGHTVRERSYGKFTRTLRLPFATKPDDVKAKMENGVLTVTFPKTNPEQEAQRITIQ